MPGLSPHNYISPNSEYRMYNGDFYLYKATNIASNDQGAWGTGGTVQKLTPEEARARWEAPTPVSVPGWSPGREGSASLLALTWPVL